MAKRIWLVGIMIVVDTLVIRIGTEFTPKIH